jgi:putative heme-binding domain-containing protein
MTRGPSLLVSCLFCLALSFALSSLAQTPVTTATPEYSPELVARLLAEAKSQGDARHGAVVFHAPQFACVSCHKVGQTGGIIGPDLSKVSFGLTPELIVEGLLWPRRQLKDEYKAHNIITSDGKVHQGYLDKETDSELVLRDPPTGKTVRLAKKDIEGRKEIGTLMPDGLSSAMTEQERRDLIRFLLELGRTEGLTELASAHSHAPAQFPLVRAPLFPKDWPSWEKPVNKFRHYDFYGREAEYFMKQAHVPILLPEYPGLDGPNFGHWGVQSEETWVDASWNKADLGSLMCGVFRGAGVTVPKGVCVRLGEKGEMSACFNPETLCYEALWQGGFVKFSPQRHGFMDGVLMNGKALPRPEGKKPSQPFIYHGYYRHGKRVVFSYTVGGVKMLDAPWFEDGKFVRNVGPADKHPLAHVTKSGDPQWPREIQTRGTLGSGGPYAIDTIPPPFDNPWRVPVYFGDHDFLPDGTAFLCTMQGDVWRVQGLDDKLDNVRWRRYASGLHQALGLVVTDGKVYVLGRDQITCLHDNNGDGEADFYECICNGYITSTGGHDFICGLQRDPAGNFYTASSSQGLLKISADGKKVESLATGFRNPDGLGLYPDGAVTVPCSEGEWTPASMLCLIQPAKKTGSKIPYFGYGGPKKNLPPDLPFVYLPRGLDNSSGGQAFIAGDKWGPLQGKMLHFSFGTCSHFLLLRDEVDGRPQGAVVQLPGEFQSGTHRGRFNPRDGQLYVSGMEGWGTYATADGCFQRVRYTGQPVQLPEAFHVHQNGIMVTFTQKIDREMATQTKNHFAQAWNYRYSAAYGSPEFSPRHYGLPGHDHWDITSAHVLRDGRTLFLEIPDLQPVNQVHLRMRVDGGRALDLFLTIHGLDKPYTDLPNYQPVEKIIAAHPIFADLRVTAKAPPNPWRNALKNARAINIQSDKNLTFVQRSLTVKAGEAIKFTFVNPDTVPHNWVLVKPGSLAVVGDLANRLIADPQAVEKQYVPKTSDVLLYTNIVQPSKNATIYFNAPLEKGRYPYLCTFPGHWMVMNGEMMVE